MTDDDWNQLLMQSLPSMKTKVILERGLDIGLAYPSEKTIVSVIAIVIIASQTVMSSAEGYAMLEQLKRLWKTSRQSRNVVATCAHFPPVVADFEKAYPGHYSDDAPPVLSRLSIALIEELRANLAARKTHRSLSAAVQGIGRPQIPSLVVFPAKRAAIPNQPMMGLTLTAHGTTNAQRGPLPLQDVCAQSSASSCVSASSVDHARVDDTAASVASPDKLRDSESPTTPGPSCPPFDAAPSSVINKKNARKPAIVGNLDDLVNEFRNAVEKNTALKKETAGVVPKGSGTGKGKPKAKASPSKKTTSPIDTDTGKRVGVDHQEEQPTKRRVMQKTPDAQSRIASKSTPQHEAEIEQKMTQPKPSRSTKTTNASPVGCALVVFSKPCITHERSRQQVPARTGCRGAGNAKAFKFEGKDSSQAMGDAIEWLRRRCAELGITWTPATS